MSSDEFEDARSVFFKMYDERFGPETGNVVTFEILVVVGTKP